MIVTRSKVHKHARVKKTPNHTYPSHPSVLSHRPPWHSPLSHVGAHASFVPAMGARRRLSHLHTSNKTSTTRRRRVPLDMTTNRYAICMIRHRWRRTRRMLNYYNYFGSGFLGWSDGRCRISNRWRFVFKPFVHEFHDVDFHNSPSIVRTPMVRTFGWNVALRRGVHCPESRTFGGSSGMTMATGSIEIDR